MSYFIVFSVLSGGCTRTVFSRGPWGFAHLNEPLEPHCFMFDNPTGESLQTFILDPVTKEVSPRFKKEFLDDEGEIVCIMLPRGGGKVLFEVTRRQVSYQKPFEELYQISYSAANRKTCIPMYATLKDGKGPRWICVQNLVVLLPINIYGKSQHGVPYLLQEAVNIKGFYLKAIEARATEIFLTALKRFGVNVPELPGNFYKTGMTLPAFQLGNFKDGITTIPDDFLQQLEFNPPQEPPHNDGTKTTLYSAAEQEQQMESKVAADFACCVRNRGACGQDAVEMMRDYLVKQGQTAVKDILVETVPGNELSAPCAPIKLPLINNPAPQTPPAENPPAEEPPPAQDPPAEEAPLEDEPPTE